LAEELRAELLKLEIAIYIVGDTMVYCSRCGKELSPGAYFCSNCGTRTEAGVQANVSYPGIDDLKQAFNRAGDEMEKAFSVVGQELKEAFRTSSHNIKDAYYGEPITCTQCGEKNPRDSSYCRKCGKKL